MLGVRRSVFDIQCFAFYVLRSTFYVQHLVFDVAFDVVFDVAFKDLAFSVLRFV